MDTRDTTLAKRIIEKVAIGEGGCWEWTAATLKQGYGKLGYCGKTLSAHRASWLAFKGLIPAGQHVLHKCDNRRCVNPEHLFLGDAAVNARDRNEKGRHARGERIGTSKLTEADVRKIKDHPEISGRAFAVMLGVSPTTVHLIRQGEHWSHV